MIANEKLAPKTEDILSDTQMKIYLYENKKTIQKLKKRGFTIRRADKANPVNVPFTHTFEFYARSALEKGEWNYVLYYYLTLNTSILQTLYLAHN